MLRVNSFLLEVPLTYSVIFHDNVVSFEVLTFEITEPRNHYHGKTDERQKDGCTKWKAISRKISDSSELRIVSKKCISQNPIHCNRNAPFSPLCVP